jgi:hypothetical protein
MSIPTDFESMTRLLLILFLLSKAHALTVQESIRYMIHYGTDPAALDRVEETTATEMTLTDLAPGTLYYASVTAIAPDGTLSQPSALVSYQVPSAAASPIVPVHVWQVNLLTGRRTLIGTHYVARKEKDFFQLSCEAVSSPDN